jgi:hypothetical protein
MNQNRELCIKEIDVLLKQADEYLTIREREFLESMKHQALEGKRENYSYGQQQWMEKIENKYSEDALREYREWEESFDNDKRLEAIRVAKYYRATTYFQHLVSKVLQDQSNFVLTKNEWNRFCENKYALKVRDCYSQPAKFKVSDCVQVRATNRIDVANCDPDAYPNRSSRYKEANKVGFIIQVDAKPVTRAARGSRIYKVLFSGETSPVYAHESDLKRKRK